MGATCCKAATEKQPPVTPLVQLGSSVAYTSRNITRHSPSWSFRWDHRTHIEDDLINGSESARYSHDNRNGIEIVSSGNGSPGITTKEVKSDNPILENKDDSAKSKVGPQDQSMVSSSSSPEIQESSNTSTSAPRLGFTPSDPETSKKTRRSPGYTLYRQVSDSRIPSLKSSFNSLSNISRSPDPLHSLSNNSSDGWSMRTFSQLVGSTSQRDLGSFNSSASITTITRMPSPDLQSCMVCSRALNERSPFSAQKIISARENPLIAVLPCGHVYHADCLDNITIEVDRYDPSCPICNYGEKFGSKFTGKIRVSRNAVVDMDVEAGSYGKPMKHKGIGSSSKGQGPKRSFSRPFLKRHFSIGSCQPETERKKRFWGRYWKD